MIFDHFSVKIMKVIVLFLLCCYVNCYTFSSHDNITLHGGDDGAMLRTQWNGPGGGGSRANAVEGVVPQAFMELGLEMTDNYGYATREIFLTKTGDKYVGWGLGLQRLLLNDARLCTLPYEAVAIYPDGQAAVTCSAFTGRVIVFLKFFGLGDNCSAGAAPDPLVTAAVSSDACRSLVVLPHDIILLVGRHSLLVIDGRIQQMDVDRTIASVELMTDTVPKLVCSLIVTLGDDSYVASLWNIDQDTNSSTVVITRVNVGNNITQYWVHINGRWNFVNIQMVANGNNLIVSLIDVDRRGATFVYDVITRSVLWKRGDSSDSEFFMLPGACSMSTYQSHLYALEISRTCEVKVVAVRVATGDVDWKSNIYEIPDCNYTDPIQSLFPFPPLVLHTNDEVYLAVFHGLIDGSLGLLLLTGGEGEVARNITVSKNGVPDNSMAGIASDGRAYFTISLGRDLVALAPKYDISTLTLSDYIWYIVFIVGITLLLLCFIILPLWFKKTKVKGLTNIQLLTFMITGIRWCLVTVWAVLTYLSYSKYCYFNNIYKDIPYEPYLIVCAIVTSYIYMLIVMLSELKFRMRFVLVSGLSAAICHAGMFPIAYNVTLNIYSLSITSMESIEILTTSRELWTIVLYVTTLVAFISMLVSCCLQDPRPALMGAPMLYMIISGVFGVHLIGSYFTTFSHRWSFLWNVGVNVTFVLVLFILCITEIMCKILTHLVRLGKIVLPLDPPRKVKHAYFRLK